MANIRLSFRLIDFNMNQLRGVANAVGQPPLIEYRFQWKNTIERDRIRYNINNKNQFMETLQAKVFNVHDVVLRHLSRQQVTYLSYTHVFI